MSPELADAPLEVCPTCGQVLPPKGWTRVPAAEPAAADLPPVATLRAWLRELVKDPVVLAARNEWEQKFLRDLAAHGEYLTPRQHQKLAQIWSDMEPQT